MNLSSPSTKWLQSVIRPSFARTRSLLFLEAIPITRKFATSCSIFRNMFISILQPRRDVFCGIAERAAFSGIRRPWQILFQFTLDQATSSNSATGTFASLRTRLYYESADRDHGGAKRGGLYPNRRAGAGYWTYLPLKMAVILACNRFSAHAITSSGVRNGRGPCQNAIGGPRFTAGAHSLLMRLVLYA